MFSLCTFFYQVDNLLDKLKQELADLERKHGIEQARQARVSLDKYTVHSGWV